MEQLLAVAYEYCPQGNNCGPVEPEVDASAVAAIIAAVGGFLLIFILIGIAFFAFWLWMLIDATNREQESYNKVGSGDKTLWILILVISLFLGLYWLSPILYYFIVRKKAKELEKPQKSTGAKKSSKN